MTIEKTYLELSDADAHKFYEVTLADCELTIRYGRIGDPGEIVGFGRSLNIPSYQLNQISSSSRNVKLKYLSCYLKIL